MAVKFRVELVWKDDDHNAASSLYLTTDGRVIVQGRAIRRGRARGAQIAGGGRDDQRGPQGHPRDQGDAVAPPSCPGRPRP